jgi:class 3 adenylate cyclase
MLSVLLSAADYYGTVVNTAARVESVCHGGQVGVTQEFCEALGGYPPETIWTDLGCQTERFGVRVFLKGDGLRALDTYVLCCCAFLVEFTSRLHS